jgi:cation diffusion facilitator family transporter
MRMGTADGAVTAPSAHKAKHHHRKGHGGSVVVALVADLVIMALKFLAADASGSSAMFAEGMHSLVDALTEVILLYGFYAASRLPTSEYQVGFGRENFFWSFIAAMVVLAAGAGVTLVDGMRQWLYPVAQGQVHLNYIVLAFSGVIELVSSAYVLRDLLGVKRKGGLAHFIRTTRDTVSLTIMFSSLAGLLGLALAATGVFLSDKLQQPALDGVASVAIALILGVSAVTIAAKSRMLLIGVPASPSTRRQIATIITDHKGVEAINGSITVYIGPNELLVGLSIVFCDRLNARAVERAVAEIETRLRDEVPELMIVFLKPQSTEDFARTRKARGW